MEKKSIVQMIRRSLDRTRKRRRGARWFYGFALLLTVAVFLLFWCTNVFRDAILSNLELRNGSAAFLLWQRPPVGLTVSVYIFNYTNLAEFENGIDGKLRVQEVGPYVYRETLSRVNVEVHANGTVTYQERRSMRWIGGRPESERVTVPNVLLMSTLAYSRNLQYLAQIMLTMVLSGLQTKPFLELPVGEYLWGYEDKLFLVAKPFAALKQPMPYDKFGILAFKNGLNADRITMHTGVDDLRNLGIIQRINGQEYRGIWGDEACDRVYGTDGSMFPPPWIEQPNSTLQVYAKDVCRQLPFSYDRRGFSSGIPTLRYKLPRNVFTSTSSKDSCFCAKESRDSVGERCPPAGTLNVSACKYGSPVLVSFPHFYSGDESLFERIDGLHPSQNRHESYIELHPRLAVTVGFRLRLQLNLEVRKATGVPLSGKLEDGSILPLIWMDSGIEDLPESVQDIFYRSHYLVNAIEAGLQWCSLIGATLSLGGFFTSLKRRRDPDEEERSGGNDDDDDDRDSVENNTEDGKAYTIDRNGTLASIELDRS